MVKGLNVQLASIEIENILKTRIEHHQNRAALYEKQIKVLGEGNDVEEIVSKFSNASNNPITSLHSSLKTHQKKIVYFTFVKNHLIPNDVYELTTADLGTLEINAY